jgi:hypothetical protein
VAYAPHIHENRPCHTLPDLIKIDWESNAEKYQGRSYSDELWVLLRTAMRNTLIFKPVPFINPTTVSGVLLMSRLPAMSSGCYYSESLV